MGLVTAGAELKACLARGLKESTLDFTFDGPADRGPQWCEGDSPTFVT